MRILDLLAPRSCAFCGQPSQAAEKSICAGCFQDLPWRTQATLPANALFEQNISLLHYVFPVDAAIKAFKFNRKLFYAPAFAEILCVASPLLVDDIDAVLPVPLHWRRKTARGFNQASEIARPVAKVLGVPLLRAVRRTKATAFQSGLDASARAGNLRQAFSKTSSVRHEHVLIIDDVVTTGATIEAVANVLLAAGAGKVSALVVARAGLAGGRI